MRLRNTLAIAMLTLAASVSLTGCGAKDEPLTEAQMQRKSQELQLQAQQQQLEIQRQQARADLEAQRLQNQALQQQMLPPQQPVYQQPVQQYGPAPAAAPAQHVDSGIGVGTAVLGAAAVGAAGYMVGKSASSNQNYNNGYNNGNNYNTTRVQPATRVVQPTYRAPAAPVYKTSTTTVSKPSAGYTRFSSTKRR